MSNSADSPDGVPDQPGDPRDGATAHSRDSLGGSTAHPGEPHGGSTAHPGEPHGGSTAHPGEPHGGPTDQPRRRLRGRPVRLLSAAVFALAGLIFVTSFNTAKGTNIRTDTSLLKLSDLIKQRDHKNKELGDTTAALRGDVDALAQRDDGSTKAEDQLLNGLKDASGTAPVSGKALTVTLNDAPPNATAAPGYPTPQANDLVIHQQDLQAVVNALWQGGAQGIQVMDQRLIATSAVRCVGNTLILQGRVYSPPYKITAVGNTGKLRAALSASPAIQNYQLYVKAYGLGWKVDEHKTMTLAAYSGTVDLHYAKPVQ